MKAIALIMEATTGTAAAVMISAPEYVPVLRAAVSRVSRPGCSRAIRSPSPPLSEGCRTLRLETGVLLALLAVSNGGLTETGLGLLELLVTVVVCPPSLDAGSAATGVMPAGAGDTPTDASVKETPGGLSDVDMTKWIPLSLITLGLFLAT